MTFVEAIRSVFSQYVGFTGRARRSEYWWFTLFSVIVGFIAGIIDVAVHTPVLQIVVGLALLLPGLAVAVRRLHDTNRTGWWILLGLVPLVGFIVLLVFYCQDSQRGLNRYGQSPKYPGAGPGGSGPQYPGDPSYPSSPYPGQ